MKIKGQDGSLAQLPLLLHMCVYFLNTVGSLCTSGQAVQSDYLACLGVYEWRAGT